MAYPSILRMEKIHEQAQDLTKQLAEENIEKRAQIDEYLNSNREL